MCRLVSCILFLNSMSLNLAFSPNNAGDFILNAVPEKLFGAEHFTNVTKDFASDKTNKADIKSHPYMAGVIVKQVLPGGGVFEKKCTGSFYLYKGGVLTTAHCVVHGRTVVDPKSVLVRFNSNYLDRGGKTITVTSVEVAQTYLKNEKGVTIFNDIAALRVNDFSAPDDVKEALKLVKALPFPSDKPDLYHLSVEEIIVRVIGYGITKESRKDNSLAEVSINLTPLLRCEHMVSDLKYKINYIYHACAYTRGVDVCRGEGGAVMLTDRKEGPLAIWSYGRNCGKEDRPAFFAVPAPEWVADSNKYQYTGRPVKSLPKELWIEDWEEVIEKEDDDEGNAPGGLENASDGAHLSGCSTVTPGGLYVIFLIVQITSLGKNN